MLNLRCGILIRWTPRRGAGGCGCSPKFGQLHLRFLDLTTRGTNLAFAID